MKNGSHTAQAILIATLPLVTKNKTEEKFRIKARTNDKDATLALSISFSILKNNCIKKRKSQNRGMPIGRAATKKIIFVTQGLSIIFYSEDFRDKW